MKNKRQALSQSRKSKAHQFKKAAPTVFRACLSSYVTFGIIAGAPLLAYLLLPLFGKPMLWQPIAILSVAFLIIFIWLRSFKIMLYDDQITYKTLFSTASSLNYSDVVQAKVESGIGNGLNRNGPTVRLVVHPLLSSRESPLIINAKVFSREDIKKILTILNRKELN